MEYIYDETNNVRSLVDTYSKFPNIQIDDMRIDRAGKYRLSVKAGKIRHKNTMLDVSSRASSVNIEGLTEVNGNFMQIRSYYDSNTNTFISEFSITLKESGTFFIYDNRFGLNDYRGIFITGGVLELGFAQIKSAILNANEDGGYRFTVN